MTEPGGITRQKGYTMTITEATYRVQDILNKYNDGWEISDEDNAEIDRLEAFIKKECMK